MKNIVTRKTLSRKKKNCFVKKMLYLQSLQTIPMTFREKSDFQVEIHMYRVFGLFMSYQQYFSVQIIHKKSNY